MSYISTLDELIQQINEAKEHCVDGNTKVHVWLSDYTDVNAKDVLQEDITRVDYNNSGVNLYFDKDE